MKYFVHKPEVQSFGVKKKHFYFDTTQTETLTITTELLKICYLLTYSYLLITLAPTSPLGEVRSNRINR